MRNATITDTTKVTGCDAKSPTEVKRRSKRQRNPTPSFSPSYDDYIELTIAEEMKLATMQKAKNNKNKNTEKKINGKKAKIKIKPKPKIEQTWPDSTVDIITLSLSQIRKAKKNPKQNSGNVNTLLHMPSAIERSKIYNETALAIARKEALALPSNGSRPWQCQVTISDDSGGVSDVDTTWTKPYFVNSIQRKKKGEISDKSGTKKKKKKYPPLFRWFRNKIELAVLPHFLQMIDVVDVNFGNRKETPTAQEENEQEDENYISTKATDLSERKVSMLSTLAWEDINHLVPEIERKWISPDQVVIKSRSKVLEHVGMLAERDKSIDRVLHGYGIRGDMLRPVKPTRNKALEAGYYRFLRDGLWVIGQEEDWLIERLETWHLKEAKKMRKKSTEGESDDTEKNKFDQKLEEKEPKKSSGEKLKDMIAQGKRWRLTSKQILLCYNAVMDQYEKVMITVKARALHHELADGFDVFRERGRGRFDMQLPVFDTPAFSFLTDLKKAAWMDIVKKILGDDAKLIHKGAFLSLPGSETQVYHQDGVHLTTKYQRPCHAINVFIPLVDLTNNNGPTEFCLGTHFLGYDYFTKDMIDIPLPIQGVPCIFDYRLGHRGLSNTSTQCRPIVYLTYTSASKEFRDSVNFSTKRLRKLGELIEKPMSRQERALKRMREAS